MRSFFTVAALAAVVLAPGLGNAATPVDAAKYHVIKRIELGGEGRWDYLNIDPAAHRLYISRSSHVMVVDTETDKVVGDIPNTTGVHGIALYPAKHLGFTSNGGDNTVTVFDTKTLKELKRIKVDTDPDCIIFDPATKRVLTFNGDGESATAIDANTLKVVGSIPLEGKPEYAVSDGAGMVYANIEDKNELVTIDAKTLKVLVRYPLAPGESPSGLSMDRKNRRLFSTCHNEQMIVINPDTGKIIASPAIGKGTDASAFDDAAGLAFSSNGDGTLTAIDAKPAGNYSVAANITTTPGARTMVVDPKTHRIYLATAQYAPAKPGEQRPAALPNSFAILVVGQ